MEIVERLQERLPETGHFQRIVLFGPGTGAHHLSAVLVRLPPAHEFSLHTHPKSEDCFFVLSGSGEALEPGRRLPIASPGGVWIPAGHPHGLCADSSGMLEVGFQSPADHTAIPFEEPLDAHVPSLLIAQHLPTACSGASAGQWAPAFPARRAWRYLDAEYTVLESPQNVTVVSQEFELVVIVASGAIELTAPSSGGLPAFSAIRLDPGTSLTLQVVASPALLVAVKARAAV